METYEETRLVKRALKKAKIESSVRHGQGTARGWLIIEVRDVENRDKAEEIARDVTRRQNKLRVLANLISKVA